MTQEKTGEGAKPPQSKGPIEPSTMDQVEKRLKTHSLKLYTLYQELISEKRYAQYLPRSPAVLIPHKAKFALFIDESYQSKDVPTKVLLIYLHLLGFLTQLALSNNQLTQDPNLTAVSLIQQSNAYHQLTQPDKDLLLKTKDATIKLFHSLPKEPKDKLIQFLTKTHGSKLEDFDQAKIDSYLKELSEEEKKTREANQPPPATSASSASTQSLRLVPRTKEELLDILQHPAFRKYFRYVGEGSKKDTVEITYPHTGLPAFEILIHFDDSGVKSVMLRELRATFRVSSQGIQEAIEVPGAIRFQMTRKNGLKEVSFSHDFWEMLIVFDDHLAEKIKKQPSRATGEAGRLEWKVISESDVMFRSPEFELEKTFKFEEVGKVKQGARNAGRKTGAKKGSDPLANLISRRLPSSTNRLLDWFDGRIWERSLPPGGTLKSDVSFGWPNDTVTINFTAEQPRRNVINHVEFGSKDPALTNPVQIIDLVLGKIGVLLAFPEISLLYAKHREFVKLAKAKSKGTHPVDLIPEAIDFLLHGKWNDMPSSITVKQVGAEIILTGTGLVTGGKSLEFSVNIDQYDAIGLLQKFCEELDRWGIPLLIKSLKTFDQKISEFADYCQARQFRLVCRHK